MLDYKFQWISECASTSRVLKDQTKDSFDKIMALAAARQTQGTGRLGRGWISLEGNLHVSLALPALVVDEDLRDVMPLAAGLLVARWISKTYEIKPCLKWPNDIVIDSLKVGGILCEASFLGSEFKGVIIGIGLNLKNSPLLDGADSSYPAGALEPLTGRTMAPQAAAESLVRFIAGAWSGLSRTSILKDWALFSMANGHLWCADLGGKRDWYSYGGLDSAGNLQLSRVVDKKSVIVSSSNHEFKWCVLTNRSFMVADVGNSRTKIALATVGTNGAVSMSNATSGDDGVRAFVSLHVKSGVTPVIHAISVNPDGLTALRGITHDLGVMVREIAKEPIRVTRSGYDLTAIGCDRLALLEALHQRHSRGALPWPAMVVSCGTATTMDFLDGSGAHLGGFILAGLQTSLDAMSSRGAMLPGSLSVDSYTGSEDWPLTSATAMIGASIGSTMSFLKSERKRLAEHCRLPVTAVNVILTGGYGELVSSQWNEDYIKLESLLVLEGAAVLVSNGR